MRFVYQVVRLYDWEQYGARGDYYYARKGEVLMVTRSFAVADYQVRGHNDRA